MLYGGIPESVVYLLSIYAYRVMNKTKYLSQAKSYQPTKAESITMSLLTFFGLSGMLLGVFADLDGIKAWCAFIGGAIMIAIRFVFAVDRWYHALWMRKMERRRIKKEMAILERQLQSASTTNQ